MEPWLQHVSHGLRNVAGSFGPPRRHVEDPGQVLHHMLRRHLAPGGNGILAKTLGRFGQEASEKIHANVWVIDPKQWAYH